MQKRWKVLIVVAVMSVLALGIGSGVAMAQAQRPAPAVALAQQGDYGPGWCHGSGYGFDQVTLSRIAGVLGLTTEELQAQLDSGKTLAEIAQSQGVSQDTLIDTILAPMQEHLAVALKYGYVTPEQADQVLAQAQDRLSTIITRQTTPPANGATWRGTQQAYRNNGGYGGMMGGSYGGGMMGGGNSRGFGGGMMGGGYGGMMGW